MKIKDIKSGESFATIPGTYVDVGPNGATITTTPVDVVTRIACRRAADFGGAMGGSIPPNAVHGKCTECKAPIVWNPATDQNPLLVGVPKICLQCYGITPLPF